MRLTPLLIPLLTLTSALRAVEPAELVDTQLQRTPIQFISLTGERLSYFDEQRRLTETGLRKYVSLRFTSSASSSQGGNAAAQSDALTLADGHVIRGRFAGVDDQQQVLWDSARFGRLALKLDDIVKFEKTPPPAPKPKAPEAPAPKAEGEAGAPPANAEHAPEKPPAITTPPPTPAASDAPLAAAEEKLDPTSDRVTLINGDKLTGFVESITPTDLVLQSGSQSVKLPWDRIAAVALANPIQHAPGTWAQLDGGTRVKIDNFNLDGRLLTGTVVGKDVEVPAAIVQQIDFATRHRLVKLAEMDWSITAGGQVFGVTMPPRLVADMAVLHAPLTLRFDLPAGAVRFAALAALSPADLDWADLQLIVSDGKGQLAAEHLSRANPSAAVNVTLRDKTLILRLDEAANGPIRDRLTLDDAVILIETR